MLLMSFFFPLLFVLWCGQADGGWRSCICLSSCRHAHGALFRLLFFCLACLQEMYILCVFLALLSVERLCVCVYAWKLTCWGSSYLVYTLVVYCSSLSSTLYSKDCLVKKKKKTTDTNNTLLLRPENVTCFYFHILTRALLSFFFCIQSH